VNLLHEARGLDTYPLSLKKFQAAGDSKSVEILNRNYAEEIFHVSTALKWFKFLCQRNDTKTGCVAHLIFALSLSLPLSTPSVSPCLSLCPSMSLTLPLTHSLSVRLSVSLPLSLSTEWVEEMFVRSFQEIVQKYYLGKMKGPFNQTARDEAGMGQDWYLPLAQEAPCKK
jgi:uncharacterized ferritin-like protein (DUF455 family)